jgi:FAD-dependent oxidoreductase domain-containing protein 1
MYDIAVAGGGVIGSSIAYHLTKSGRAGRVAVIEPDPTYEFASTPRSAGGIRRLFSLPENIRMSAFSLEFYQDFERLTAVDGDTTPLGFRQEGYLFLYPPEKLDLVRKNYDAQRTLSCPVHLLDRAGIERMFPSLGLDDIAVGVHSPEDGWIDPYSAVRGFRRKAQAQGADYIRDRVVGVELSGRRASAFHLAERDPIEAKVFINAAGAWAGEICESIGMPLPIEPLRRLAFYFETQQILEPLPLVKDLSGLFFRPEGAGYITGVPNMSEPPGINFDVDYDYFDNVVWPLLALRVPAFEALKVRRGWAGMYDQNRFDGNLMIGPWEGQVDNFHVAVGFSGHGLQQAPAVGLALAELVLDGRFATIDLSRLRYRRIMDDTPLREDGII